VNREASPLAPAIEAMALGHFVKQKSKIGCPEI